jgi:orotidine 5'-phosphate decarboxylase subfamily 2
MTGFEKLEKLIKEKNSHLVLGIDPTDEEIKDAGNDLEGYLKGIIDQTAEYIVGIKPQLAFYECCPEYRQIAMNLAKHAKDKGLAVILDVKRGDIADTQKSWAKADIKNFNPDIVTLNAYMGSVDVIKPYLDADPNICVYALVATSNPDARLFQDSVNNGLLNYQQMALIIRDIDAKRVGYVIGSTKTDAVINVRMLECEHQLNFAHVLAPGFGKQGKNLEFIHHAGTNTVYPISSGLTKKDYMVGNNSAESAKWWRDEINKQLKNAVPPKTITQHVVDLLVKENLILIPKSPDVATWPLLKRGRDTLKAKSITLEGDENQKITILQKALKDGVLTQDDFGKIFLQLRDLMTYPEVRRLVAYLYVQMIQKSKVEFDTIGMVAYGAINTGDIVSYILDKPAILLRKERGTETTHSDVVGRLKKGDKVIMIEDVTTTADSLIQDTKMLREKFGVVIEHAFIMVKRTAKSEQNCKEAGINLHYIMDMEQLKSLCGIE